MYVERDTIVICNISHGKTKVPKIYIVLGLHDEYYNKWFMMGERKRWGSMVTDAEKKKFKVAICMTKYAHMPQVLIGRRYSKLLMASKSLVYLVNMFVGDEERNIQEYGIIVCIEKSYLLQSAPIGYYIMSPDIKN